MNEALDALRQPHVQLLLRLVLGGLLVLAGIAKLADRASFRRAVAEYEILPPAFEHPFAALLPWAEVSLGALLLLGLGTTAAAALAAPLFLTFAAAIGVNLVRGRNFDCHCFGAAQNDQIGGPALLRSLALATIAVVIATGASRFGAIEAALFGSSTDLPSVSEIIPVVLLAVVAFDVLILLPEATALRTNFWAWQRTRITGSHANGHHKHASEIEIRSAP